MSSISDLHSLRQTLTTLPQLSIELWQSVIENILLRYPDTCRVLFVKRWIPVKQCLIPDSGTYDRPFYTPEVNGLGGREAELIRVLGYDDTFYPGSSQDFWRWYIPRVTWRTEVKIIEQGGIWSWSWSLEDLERLEREFGVRLTRVDAVIGHVDRAVELDDEWRDLDAALKCTEAVLQRFGYAHVQLIIDVKPQLDTSEANTRLWDRDGLLAWFWLKSCHLRFQEKRVSVCLRALEYVDDFGLPEHHWDHDHLGLQRRTHLRDISHFWDFDECSDWRHRWQRCCSGMTAPNEIEPWRKYNVDDCVEWKDHHHWEAIVKLHHFQFTMPRTRHTLLV